MSKRKHPMNLPPGQRVKTVEARSLTATATDQRETKILYANHAQFAINPNEIFIDFYRLEPNPADAGKTEAALVQRVVIPLGLAKGFATGLANLVAGYEKTLGVIVPNRRTPDPEDIIKIWEDQ